jgi:hypothetical protein
MVDLLARALPLARAIGRQGQRHTLATYSWSQVRKRWLDVLQHVATGARGTHGGSPARAAAEDAANR